MTGRDLAATNMTSRCEGRKIENATDPVVGTALSECGGEDVAVTGTFHRILTITSDNAGGFYVDDHQDFTGLQGAGHVRRQLPYQVRLGRLDSKKNPCGTQRRGGFYAPGETRTPNLLIRSQMLYPIELRALSTANCELKWVFQFSASRVGGTRLELVTSTMSTWRSNQLS